MKGARAWVLLGTCKRENITLHGLAPSYIMDIFPSAVGLLNPPPKCGKTAICLYTLKIVQFSN